MCGIIGVTVAPLRAKDDPYRVAEVLVRGLFSLEYRGYDSVGIAVVGLNGELVVKKAKGTVERVSAKLNFRETPGCTGIGHTRWATHGPPSDSNAHPHTDCSSRIAVAHNGIIRNHLELRKTLEEAGHVFKSDTDTEVVAHLIEDYLSKERCFYSAFKQAVQKLEGSYAIVAITVEDPHRVFFAKKESPLIIGFGEDENYVASDIPALIENTRKVAPLEDFDVGWVSPEDVFVENILSGKHVDLKSRVITVSWRAEMAKKGGYPHFMIKEIHEQPLALKTTYEGLMSDRALDKAAEIIVGCNRLFIAAAGTSYHAGLVTKYFLERIAKIPVYAFISSEYKHASTLAREGDAIILISQSGETIDTLKALRTFKDAGATTIAVTNVLGSAIDRESDYTILTRAGPEIGVAATKTFSTQVLTGIMLTVKTASRMGMIGEKEEQESIKELASAGEILGRAIEASESIMRTLSERMSGCRNAYFLGRGMGVPLAMEAALKLKEISYIHAEAYPAGESKHGPIAIVEKDFPVFFFATSDTLEEIPGNVAEMNARGAYTVLFCTANAEISADPKLLVRLPEATPLLEPFVFIPPFQLLSYYTAVRLGYDPDKPRNLAKTVTVE